MPRKVSLITRIAISTFQKMVKAKCRAEILRHELEKWVAKIPPEEFDFYVEATEKIQKEEEDRLQKFLYRRRYKTSP